MAHTKSTGFDTILFTSPKSLEDIPLHYCPGCGHGIIHRLIAEVVDELVIADRTICLASAGCSGVSYLYFRFDGIESAHGRAPASASAIKRCRHDSVVFTYQGDGDLAAIGTAEIVHACARGENITVIFVNNAIYGMTGGQMAPTTPIGMHTSSTPGGRNATLDGYPIKVCEMLSTLEGTAYIARVSIHNPAQVRKAKQAIKLAFKAQLSGLGLALVEVLSSCPIGYGLEPVQAMDWIVERMLPQYPLGEYKITEAVQALKEAKDDA